MITFRKASSKDALAIAELHADSWQKHYANVYPSDYLENEVLNDRTQVWKERFDKTDENRNVILAEQNGELLGFACTFINHESGFGALLDNLHVSKASQGKGIGLKLLQKSFNWAKAKEPNQVLFLYVLKDNIPAKEFYYRFGGKYEETSETPLPNDELVEIERISWKERPELAATY